MKRLQPIKSHEEASNPQYASTEGQQLLEAYRAFYKEVEYRLPWVGYAIIDGNQLVGSCGFTSQPKENKIEIAYWTFETYEGQGIATFACKSLIEIAKEEIPDIQIIAKTAPMVNASVKILKNNGFIFKGIVQDHENGDAWMWELGQ